MSVTEPPLRDANGRFQPGQSGNPAGKKPGTRNRATLLREALKDGEDGAVARVIIDKALAGNAVAARFVIGLLIPRARDRAIELDLPEGASAGELVAAANATVQAMATGEITPEEALTVTRVLDFRLKAVMAAGREKVKLSPRTRSEPSPHKQKSPSPLALGVASPRLPRQRGPLVPARAGEGRGEGVAAGSGEKRQQPPHPPIAIAMGPSLFRKGRGDLRLRRSAEIIDDLLHSTCISSPSGWRGLLAA